jgi:hypothetical protein
MLFKSLFWRQVVTQSNITLHPSLIETEQQNDYKFLDKTSFEHKAFLV